jgi:hypothetical protein
MIVPARVIELHKPNAAFHQAPGQQAIRTNGFVFSWLMPYISRVRLDSLEKSSSSGALACIVGSDSIHDETRG